MKHERLVDWLCIMGMQDSAEIIDSDRCLLYAEYGKYLNIRNVLLSDFSDTDKKNEF